MIGAVIVSGTLFSTWVTHEETITVNGLLEFDSQPMGDLTINDNFDTYGNCWSNITHWLNYTGNDSDLNIDFTWSGSNDCLTDGSITAYVYYNDTITDTMLLQAGHSYQLTFCYYTNMMIVPDTYIVNVTINPS